MQIAGKCGKNRKSARSDTTTGGFAWCSAFAWGCLCVAVCMCTAVAVCAMPNNQPQNLLCVVCKIYCSLRKSDHCLPPTCATVMRPAKDLWAPGHIPSWDGWDFYEVHPEDPIVF